jgi:hypothetical protein
MWPRLDLSTGITSKCHQRQTKDVFDEVVTISNFTKFRALVYGCSTFCVKKGKVSIKHMKTVSRKGAWVVSELCPETAPYSMKHHLYLADNWHRNLVIHIWIVSRYFPENEQKEAITPRKTTYLLLMIKFQVFKQVLEFSTTVFPHHELESCQWLFCWNKR